jgi:hypothetical protein
MAQKETLEQKLSKPLPKNAIKQREGGRGIMLDYLEGWWVKQNANKIFGIGNWSFEPYWEQMEHITLPDHKGKKTGFYTIPSKLTVTIGTEKVVKSDIGITQYYGEDGKEMAIKGCVTDSLKRCFASFGEQFGLLLYDKGDEIQPRTGNAAIARGYPTQEELMKKYKMDPKQVAPKCPNCGNVMKIIERKDKTGIFWSCANWRTKGCQGYNIDDIEIDGAIPMKKKVKVVAKVEPKDDIPF